MSRQAIQSAPSAPSVETPVARSSHLDASLQKANLLALGQHHAGVSSEHLLFALTEDVEALVVLGASTVNIDRLRADITTHLSQLPNTTPAGKAMMPTADLLKVLKLAAMAAQQSARRQIDGAIVLAAVIGDASTPSAGLLRAHGLTFNEVIRVLQKSAGPVAQMPAAQVQITQPSPPPVPSPTVEAKVAPPISPAVGAPTPRPSTDELLASVRARLQETALPPPARRTERLVEERPGPPPVKEQPSPAPEKEQPSPAPAKEKPNPAPSEDPSGAIVETVVKPKPAASIAEPPTVAIRTAKDAAASFADDVRAAPPAARDIQRPAPKVNPDELSAGPRTPTDLVPPQQPWPGVQQPTPSADAPVAVSPAPTMQPPLPLVPASGLRSGPPPLPLPTMANPSVAAPRPAQPPVPKPNSTAGAVRVPPIPQPTVDMRSLVATFPRRLRQGQTDVIEIVVPRRSLEIPPDSGHRWPPLRVATMRLRSGNDDAHVQLASPETLWISPPRVHQGADDATWRWRVTPRNKGRIKLSLAGATRIVGSEGITSEIPLGEETIEIDVARRGSRRGLVGLLLFGNLIALGFLAMLMSGRATELILWGLQSVRRLLG